MNEHANKKLDFQLIGNGHQGLEFFACMSFTHSDIEGMFEDLK